MKENNKSNNVTNSLLDVETITSTIKEETKGTLKNLLAEAVKEYMNESIIKEAEEEKEDSYEVEDVDDNTTDETGDDTAPETSEMDVDADSADTASLETDINLDDDSEESGTEWSEFDQYKTEDGDYDFTGVEDDETIIKVYKLLKDDDQVVIKQDGDKVDIKDNETGAEYVIELNPEEDVATEDSMEGDESDSLEDSDEIELDLDDESVNEAINLGYTDNYQDVDPMTTSGMNEPAKSSETNSWDKGVPTGTKKPWAGKGSSAPFDKTIKEENEDTVPADEEGEGNVDEITTVTANNARKVPKTHTSEPRRSNLPYGSKHISAGGKYDENVTEAILKKAKAIQEENKQYKACVDKIKNALQEAAVVNVSLGQIVKLFTENTTSTKEKKAIIDRFSNVATVKESKALYESIKRELNKEQKPNVVLEKQMTTGSATINETPVYQSKDILEALDLIKRVEKC